jgi:hypothetical protein
MAGALGAAWREAWLVFISVVPKVAGRSVREAVAVSVRDAPDFPVVFASEQSVLDGVSLLLAPVSHWRSFIGRYVLCSLQVASRLVAKGGGYDRHRS